jgi:hypothetical protein
VDQCIKFGANPAQHRVSFRFRVKMIQSRYLVRHVSRRKKYRRIKTGEQGPQGEDRTARRNEMSGQSIRPTKPKAAAP